SFRCAWSSGASILLFFSQSRTAVSRTEDTDTLRRCASRSRSDLSSSDKRQLYTSVFMHYIVVQNCITLQYIFLHADYGPTRCRGRFPASSTGTQLERMWKLGKNQSGKFLLVTLSNISWGKSGRAGSSSPSAVGSMEITCT